MLTVHSDATRDCSGLTRRNFVRAGLWGVGALSLPQLLAARAAE